MAEALAEIFNHLPPSDIESEMCAIGSLLVCPDRSEQLKLRNSLRAEWFHSPDNAILFTSIAKMLDSGKAIDSVTLSSWLVDSGTLDEIGGVEYMARIFNKVPSWLHGKVYADRVKELAIRRTAISICYKAASAMYENMTPEETQSWVSSTITNLWKLSQAGSSLKIFSLEEILHEFMEFKEQRRPTALLTGIRSLDDCSGVFSFGGYAVIAGRPGMGKSTMVRWLLGEWAKAGTRCGLIAVEEGRQKIAGNYISSEASMENHIVAYRDWGAPEWEEATNAVSSMVGRPLFCVDSAFKLEEVSAAFERLATEKKCQVIAVDHIHLIRMDKAGETEQREIKDISARIKELTKRFNVVGIALAQLHRPADKSRIPVPPTLTDLRASGAIEEHCDSAMFIHREDYYRRGESKTNECNIGIEKNRNGRTGNCTLRAELQYQRFSDAMQPMENT